MILAGSQALKMSIPSWRDPKDIDWIATQDEYNKFVLDNKSDIVLEVPSKWGMTVHKLGSKPIEFEIAKDGNLTEQFIDLWRKNSGILAGDYFLLPDEVLTFKMSHRYKKDSPHFKKCMDDILELRRLGYETIPEYLKDWFKLREKETYNYKHPKLNQSKDGFFNPNEGIDYIYDHDTIHEAVKTFDRPAFMLIMDDQADVFCSKQKFFSLPKELQLATVLEESYTLALERSQIPNNFKPDAKASFLKALEKVCTSISSGWWKEFSYDHYYQVLALYNEDYVIKFHKALADGIIKPYKGK
jgi:hypothetical protein